MGFARIIVSVTALVAFLALAASASAEPLTSPAGTPYEGTLHAESEAFEMHGEAFSFNCKSTLEAEFGSQASTTT
ncbi:MAG TPA: hypothetical protein VFY69_09985, partial [Solirubrobacterales bacterium]|nr:hypothetical protein [Solirubrobacterales bacterium]